MTLFCKDCKYYYRGLVINLGQGHIPSGHYCKRLRYLVDKEDIITGPYLDYAGDTLDCRDERKTGDCGPDGTFWMHVLRDDGDYSKMDWFGGEQ